MCHRMDTWAYWLEQVFRPCLIIDGDFFVQSFVLLFLVPALCAVAVGSYLYVGERQREMEEEAAAARALASPPLPHTDDEDDEGNEGDDGSSDGSDGGGDNESEEEVDLSDDEDDEGRIGLHAMPGGF